MAEDKREFTDMHPTFPDENKVKCKDCAYRDKTEVTLFGKSHKVGITRDTCEVYKGSPLYKPTDVLFQNADCQYYVKDDGS